MAPLSSSRRPPPLAPPLLQSKDIKARSVKKIKEKTETILSLEREINDMHALIVSKDALSLISAEAAAEQAEGERAELSAQHATEMAELRDRFAEQLKEMTSSLADKEETARLLTLAQEGERVAALKATAHAEEAAAHAAALSKVRRRSLADAFVSLLSSSLDLCD